MTDLLPRLESFRADLVKVDWNSFACLIDEAISKIREMATELSEVRSDRQREHELRVRYAGVTETYAERIRKLRFRKFEAAYEAQVNAGMALFEDNERLRKRIAELERERDDALSDYRRWHQAFLDAKYPDVLPTRVDLEKRIATLEAHIIELRTQRDEWKRIAESGPGITEEAR